MRSLLLCFALAACTRDNAFVIIDLADADLAPDSCQSSRCDAGDDAELDGGVRDALPPASDLACAAYIAGAISPTMCSPGQVQMTSSPMGCYKKVCGCKDRMSCADCYWSPWIQTQCP